MTDAKPVERFGEMFDSEEGWRFVQCDNGEYVKLEAYESVKRERDELASWITEATKTITNAIGGGSEMFTRHGDAYRVDPAYVASFIKYCRDNHISAMSIAVRRQRDLKLRAEAAEREREEAKAELATSRSDVLEEAAKVVDANVIKDTCDGKVLRPRQDGNLDGLHYAAAIRALKEKK